MSKVLSVLTGLGLIFCMDSFLSFEDSLESLSLKLESSNVTLFLDEADESFLLSLILYDVSELSDAFFLGLVSSFKLNSSSASSFLLSLGNMSSSSDFDSLSVFSLKPSYL